jgi:hypothetical protein
MTRIVARRWRGWIWAGIGAFLVVGGLIWLWSARCGISCTRTSHRMSRWIISR